MALPIIAANAAAPLLGLADTAVISHTGDVAAVGAVALGGLIFSFLYWGFGFLRMGTSGYVAQAAGAQRHAELLDHVIRALLIGFGIGVFLLLLQWPLLRVALYLFDASPAVESQLSQYWNIRIWSAPASIATFAITGLLIGLGKSQHLLWLQLLLNACNLLFDLLLVIGFSMGVQGIALGTVIAEWLCFFAGLLMVKSLVPDLFLLSPSAWLQRLGNIHRIKQLINTNANIFWRTLCQILCFAFFINMAAQLGDNALAANHILLQFIALSAFFLDGYAYVAESLIGKAIGSRNRVMYQHTIKVSSVCAAVTALLLASIWWLAGAYLIHLLTPVAAVIQIASSLIPYAAVYVLLSFAAFQLDGIFIGALFTREMRNAAIISAIFFVGSAFILQAILGQQGLWLSFIGYVVMRAITLGIYFPRIGKSL